MLLVCFYEINKKHFVRLMLKYYITEKYYYLLFIIYYLLFITLLVIMFSNSLELNIITITHCVHIYNRFFVSLLLKHATDYVIHDFTLIIIEQWYHTVTLNCSLCVLLNQRCSFMNRSIKHLRIIFRMYNPDVAIPDDVQ